MPGTSAPQWPTALAQTFQVLRFAQGEAELFSGLRCLLQSSDLQVWQLCSRPSSPSRWSTCSHICHPSLRACRRDDSVETFQQEARLLEVIGLQQLATALKPRPERSQGCQTGLYQTALYQVKRREKSKKEEQRLATKKMTPRANLRQQVRISTRRQCCATPG